jgi:broad specificity phosphatase PhoE
MIRPTRIHLVRHGEVHNPDKVLYGRLPGFRLSRRGQEQAAAAAGYLKPLPIDAVFSSPLLRARQTAARILAPHNPLKLRTSSLLNEACTPYEGRPGRVIDARGGDVYTFDNPKPCHEQPADILSRVHKFIGRTLAAFPGGQVAAVTHGDVIVFTVLFALGRDITPANKNRLKPAGFPDTYPATASVTTLTFQTLSAGERPHLDYRVPWR